MQSEAFKKWQKTMILSAKEKKIPICGHYELTACCNLDCKMCFIHNADSNALRARELSTDTWKRIFDEAYEMGLMFAALSGGECLLRPDFKELYLHLWKKRVFITVLTNGTLINDDYIDFFKKYPPKLIRISLYGSNEEGYREVTGHNGFEKAVSAIRKLKAENIPVGVMITPSQYMKDDFINTNRVCKDLGIACKLSEFSLLNNRDNPEKDDYNLTIDEIVQLASEQYELLYGPLTPVENTPEPCRTGTEAPKGLICSAGASTAVVSFDGRMYPCVMLAEGNISVLEMSYAEAWEKTKQAAAEMLLGMECVDCPYDKACPKCPAVRLTGLHTGHCKPEVCEITRRLVAAGVKKLPATE